MINQQEDQQAGTSCTGPLVAPKGDVALGKATPPCPLLHVVVLLHENLPLQ